jgi:hypothetical protein
MPRGVGKLLPAGYFLAQTDTARAMAGVPEKIAAVGWPLRKGGPRIWKRNRKAARDYWALLEAGQRPVLYQFAGFNRSANTHVEFSASADHCNPDILGMSRRSLYNRLERYTEHETKGHSNGRPQRNGRNGLT